ncbi:MFS transporter [Actinoplanes aureus]|uniref:MFS transporter n=1 Tax=Actinoplanes aureus TaxID=2792083 RepID=A0A931G2X6_9ACTN|nr:MFS transporter [Actinoplanes aureus]MBG0566506.1 MFS transporter [Actinoplanes aureus]
MTFGSSASTENQATKAHQPGGRQVGGGADRHRRLAGAPAKATVREWLGLAVLCLPTMLAAVDVNITFLALPHLSADLGASSTQQLWISDVYGFLIAGFLITAGNLGDRIGRRTVLLGGAALFLVASIAAAYAVSPEMLVAARAVLGVAGATLIPSVLALLREMFQDPRQMGAAMGAWGTSLMAGMVLGPVIGGLLLDSFWWGSIFLMAVPVMALLLLTAPLLVPDSRDPAARRLDLISVVLSVAAALPFIYGVKTLARDGWDVAAVVALIAGLCCAVWFVLRQRRVSNPLLDLSLFSNRALSTTLVLALLIAFVMGGVGLMGTLYLQLVAGRSPFETGLWLLLPSAVMIIVGNLAPAIARKVRPAYVLMTGSIVAAAGMVVLTQVPATSGLTILLAGITIVYVGGAAVGPMAPFLVMSSAPPQKAGAAGSLASTAGELGVALGVAILGVIGGAVYRNQVEVPGGVPHNAAAAAHDSITGAVTVVPGLPADAGAALLTSARTAFTDGLHIIAIVSVVIFVVLAVVARLGLGHLPSLGDMPMPGTAADADRAPAGR